MATPETLHVALAALRKYALNASEASAQAQSLLEELQRLEAYGVTEFDLDHIDDTAALTDAASILDVLRVRAMNAVNQLEQEIMEKQNEQ